MSELQSQVGSTVIAFRPRSASVWNLSAMDRMDIAGWRPFASLSGYDRMVIHERESGDAPEVGTFLSIYRTGQPWAHWCLARNGRMVRAWCAPTGQDLGQFASIDGALRAIMPECEASPSVSASSTLVHLSDAC